MACLDFLHDIDGVGAGLVMKWLNVVSGILPSNDYSIENFVAMIAS